MTPRVLVSHFSALVRFPFASEIKAEGVAWVFHGFVQVKESRCTSI